MYKQTKMSSQIMPNVFCPSYQNLSSEKKKITPQAKMTKDIIILFSLNIVFMCRNIRTKARGYMNTLPSRKHDELINLECDLI